jgi:hypothetical protein
LADLVPAARSATAMAITGIGVRTIRLLLLLAAIGSG